MVGVYKSIAIVLIASYAGYAFSPKNRIGGASIGVVLGIILGIAHWSNGVKNYLSSNSSNEEQLSNKN